MVCAETIDAPEPGEAEHACNGSSSRAPLSARLSRWARELRLVSGQLLERRPWILRRDLGHLGADGGRGLFMP